MPLAPKFDFNIKKLCEKVNIILSRREFKALSISLGEMIQEEKKLEM